MHNIFKVKDNDTGLVYEMNHVHTALDVTLTDEGFLRCAFQRSLSRLLSHTAKLSRTGINIYAVDGTQVEVGTSAPSITLQNTFHPVSPLQYA